MTEAGNKEIARKLREESHDEGNLNVFDEHVAENRRSIVRSTNKPY